MVHTAPEIYMSNVISNSEDTVFKISLGTEDEVQIAPEIYMSQLIANSKSTMVKSSGKRRGCGTYRS